MKSILPSKSSPQKRPNKKYSLFLSNPVKDRKFSHEERTRIIVEGQSGGLTILEICEREGITPAIFYQWSVEFIEGKKHVEHPAFKHDQDYKFRIALEGQSGETSVAEICKREGISQEKFLSFCKEFSLLRRGLENRKVILDTSFFEKKKDFQKLFSAEVFQYLDLFLDLSVEIPFVIRNANNQDFTSTPKLQQIVCSQKINDIRFINKFFENVNQALSEDGIFVGCMETIAARMKRKRVYQIALLNRAYFGAEFLLKRILPKLSFTKGFYFDLTKGKDRILSKAEGLGRLVSCGFKIMDYKEINGIIYFVVKKNGLPTFDQNPSYGPLYKMPRVGRNGETIGVYKFRTMHPYSEYLQEYLIKTNGYAETGKPAADFRIPPWGKFMRRYWLDELPQLLNVLKGDMKLVGIRPVSKTYFNQIPKEMQKLRLTQKPGCIPPYVSLNRKGSVMGVLEAEREYLEEKIAHPYITDTKYFFKAVFNIVFKHKRSA